MPLLDQVLGCIAKGDLNRLISLLNKSPALVNSRSEDGIGLLHYSVLLDQGDILIYLTNIAKCQLTQCDAYYEHTALHLACFHDSVKMVQTIVQKMNPSEVNVQDKFGWTALHHAARNGNTPLCRLLIKNDAKLDIQNELGKAPIHYAAQHGYLEIVELMYDHVGPSVTPSPTEVFCLPIPTLLHFAAMNDHLCVVEWLQRKLYPPNIKCRRALHQNGNITSEAELPEDTALKRGHFSLKANLQAYHSQYDVWLKDIIGECSPLDYIKLCFCGPVDGGKTTLKDLLEKSHLQLMLGRSLESNESSENGKKHTYGIDVSHIQLNSKEGFNLWDFSGDLASYITHGYFMTTERTIYSIVLDLTQPISELKTELDKWLMLIKAHNLGAKQVYCSNRRQPDIVDFPDKINQNSKSKLDNRIRSSTFSNTTKLRDRLYSSTLRPPARLGRPLSPPGRRGQHMKVAKSASTLNPKPTVDPNPVTAPIEAEILPLMLQVPILIVGSHFNCLQDKSKKETVRLVDEMVLEASKKFQRSLNVIPQVFPLSGGERFSSSEIRYLKEQLSAIRASLIENSCSFPRVFDKVAKKIESMKLECPNQKVIEFVELSVVIRSQINGLLSDAQIAHILRHLTNTGMIVYTHPLTQWVFLCPGWLSGILGLLLSPPTHPNHIPLATGEITGKALQACLPDCEDSFHLNIALKLIRNLELGFTISGSNMYRLCAVMKCENNEDSVWKEDDRYMMYNGRQMCTFNSLDSLPPGFVLYLQSQVQFMQKGQNVETFSNGLVLSYSNHQCLVRVDSSNQSISIIGRICSSNDALQCLNTLDYAQLSVAKVCRILCPAIFFEWNVLNPLDLTNHTSLSRSYPASVVIASERRRSSVNTIECGDKIDCKSLDAMFFGDPELSAKNTGLGMKVAYLDDNLFEKTGDLLTEDGIQPGWKILAEHLNLTEYIEYLEGERNPTKKLMLKWGEKPRWTVHSLLFALQDIKRVDVYDYVRAKMNPKYE